MFLHIVSRRIAQERGFVRYFTGKPCKYGHVAERRVDNWSCEECTYFKNRSLKKKERNRKYNKNNKQKVANRKREYYEENKEYFKNYKKKWWRENLERMKLNQQRYYQENKYRFVSYAAKRKVLKLERCLGDYFKEEINEIYKESQRRRVEGEDVEVDHIVPLQGNLVSGLHVPWNLEIVEASYNRSKKNKFIPYVEIYNEEGD